MKIFVGLPEEGVRISLRTGQSLHFLSEQVLQVTVPCDGDFMQPSEQARVAMQEAMDRARGADRDEE